MKIGDRFSAYAVLKGPDTIPFTNPTKIAAQFRRTLSLKIVSDSLGEKVAEKEISRVIKDKADSITDIDKKEILRAKSTGIGTKVSESA